jgi:2-iminoacetate synthase ThiH
MGEGDNTGEVVQLVENEDYYLDHGLMVLTASYHLRRGYCCEQGCRHCPYRNTTKEKPEAYVDENETNK